MKKITKGPTSIEQVELDINDPLVTLKITAPKSQWVNVRNHLGGKPHKVVGITIYTFWDALNDVLEGL